MQLTIITADQAQPGDVWLGNGDIRITAVGEGPTVDYIPAGSDETIRGPLVRIEGRIISGQDQGFVGSWAVQPGQHLEVRRA